MPALVLPAVKKYKLAVVLDVLEEGDWDHTEEKPELPPTESDKSFSAHPREYSIVKCIQEDLPLVQKTFQLYGPIH